MNYEVKYKQALERARKLGTREMPIDPTCSIQEQIFPELAESEDEKIRRKLIELVEESSALIDSDDYPKMISWLEKQGEQQKMYIRFGDIPENEESGIYCGEEQTGKQEGVSVYPAIIDEMGNISLGLLLPITATTLHTQQHLIEYDNRPCYLVTGDCIGTGVDGEPLLKNVKIIKEVKDYRKKNDLSKQKPVEWSEKDKKISDAIYESLDFLVLKSFGVSEDDVVAWLEKQKTVEQDTETRDTWEYIREWTDKFGRFPKDEDELAACIDYVIQRQKKCEWGEEDKDMMKETIYFINEFQKSDRCKDENDMQNSVTCENWLKTLKPQPHWMPIEEQLTSLGRFIEGVYGCVDFTNIKSLYQDLKKL